MISKIRIIGKVYDIVENPDLAHDGDYGQVIYRKQLIEFSPGQKPDQLRDTLLHEAIHVIEKTIHLDLKEYQVHALAGGIYALLKDNPEFAQWLIKESTETLHNP